VHRTVVAEDLEVATLAEAEQLTADDHPLAGGVIDGHLDSLAKGAACLVDVGHGVSLPDSARTAPHPLTLGPTNGIEQILLGPAGGQGEPARGGLDGQ
jgi:hypothetical protein